MNNMKRINQSGFAMMEVLVTAIILAIGISGMGVLLLKAVQGTQDSSQQSQAMWMVQDYVSRIRANSDGARAGFYTIAGGQDCSVKPARVCAEYFEGGAEVPAVECSTQEMAVFDQWITVCGLDDDVLDSAADFIANPQLTSTCTMTTPRVSTISGAPDCVQYRVELQWDTKVKQAGDSDAERVYQNDYSMVVELN